jgi:pimeloyl-ACP methyl ester carboxylesterase
MPESISYRSAGDGEKLVLLHGFCETRNIWNKIVPLLAENFQVITADLPGFGNSPLPSEDISIGIIAEKVSRWLKMITDEKLILMGHSMGGYIALALAERHPEQLKGLGLLNSTAFSDDDVKKGNRLKTVDFLKSHGKDTFLDSFVPGLFYDSKSSSGKRIVQEAREISGKTSLPAMISYMLAMRERPSRIHLLQQKNLPVLFIAGKNDQVIPEHKSKEQMQLIIKGQSYFLADTAHMSMMEKPEETARLIKIFINQLNT